MLFLVHYDRERGHLVDLREFADSDAASAADARLELELELHRNGSTHEIVILEAAGRDDLWATHRQYFADVAELAAWIPTSAAAAR